MIVDVGVGEKPGGDINIDIVSAPWASRSYTKGCTIC